MLTREIGISTANKAQQQVPLWLCILLVIVLYTLQGATLALVDIVPLYIASLNATWTHQGTLSFASYPLILKLLWAPLIDVCYIRWLGRRLTWLLPVQLLLGIMLITFSFYFEMLMVQLHITKLTIILFFMVFLVATQDICVDGWALTLFPSSHIVWQSISQTIGEALGDFLGSSFLLTFESANMTNRLIRQPLGIATQTYGLFTLGQFVRSWGMVFLITTCVITISFRKQRQNSNTSGTDHDHPHLSLLETYLYIFKLLKKKNFLQFITILVVPHFSFAATLAMTNVTLINRGMITRATLGLMTMPFILIKIIVPLLFSRINHPLIFYARTYFPRLILCLIIAIFIFFGTRLQSNPIIFYILLVTLLALNDAINRAHSTLRGNFMAYVSDTRVGSTYFTLVVSFANAGIIVSSSVVLNVANWLPKEQAYFIEVGICVLVGCIWLCISWRIIYRLQLLPVERWHLTLRSRKHDEAHQMVIINEKGIELSATTVDIESSSQL